MDAVDTRFLFRLRRGEAANAVHGLKNLESRAKELKALGLEPVCKSGLTWRGDDLDGLKLAISIRNEMDNSVRFGSGYRTV